MKKMKKLITGVLTVFFCMAAVLPVTTVKAAEEKEAELRCYTVTFRAGNVAEFDTANIQLPQETEVTKNYIKVRVAKGETIASVVSEWNSDAALTAWFSSHLNYEKKAVYGLKALSNVAKNLISRNTEYVLDYERLIDPVSYTVSYVDMETKEQIAMPTIVYGNAEENITVYPAAVSDYTPTESSQVMKLEKGKENTTVFEYNYTGPVDTVTSTVTRVVPGTTRTETVVNEIEETVIVPGNAASDVRTNMTGDSTNAGNQTQTVGNQVRNTGGQIQNIGNQNQNANGRTQPATNQTQNEDEVEQNENNGDNVEIPDDQTPLAEGEDETVEIEESETPLANALDVEEATSTEAAKQETASAAQGLSGTFLSVAVPVLAGIVGVLIIGIAVYIVYKKRARK